MNQNVLVLYVGEKNNMRDNKKIPYHQEGATVKQHTRNDE